jgi:hypothetical protein
MGPRGAVVNFIIAFFPLMMIPVFFYAIATKEKPILLLPAAIISVGIICLFAAKWSNLRKGVWHSFGTEGMGQKQQKLHLFAQNFANIFWASFLNSS